MILSSRWNLGIGKTVDLIQPFCFRGWFYPEWETQEHLLSLCWPRWSAPTTTERLWTSWPSSQPAVGSVRAGTNEVQAYWEVSTDTMRAGQNLSSSWNRSPGFHSGFSGTILERNLGSSLKPGKEGSLGIPLSFWRGMSCGQWIFFCAIWLELSG